ncbi:hypothetical protein XPR_3985 [Xanthomonas arboricola pv. pruni MAFF 301420]|uniref:Urocanate hydratase n=1 Tax=Xanthomonas arboricola pv. pruni MAFF 301420 TaxID=1418095 RepID=W4SL99_9XANT|nr:hypothetical protein XPR_3985 [Xanthomonas arboricola pv. pruni MAFF 301420]
MTRHDATRVIRAATGTTLTAKSWLTEAPLRMLMNNLDPDVAERPQELVVYGGIGRAARDWESFDAIIAALTRLDDDQTLLVQSGKPVGVFRTHADAPRVLIANSNLVPRWASWEHFNELDRKGLAMYGQMTAGSWIYIGAQGIVQGTYETFVEMGRQHYGGSLAGKWLFTGGLGGMGGAQPLAAVMAGASCLAVECRRSSIDMRLRTGYLDTWTDDLDEALRLIEESCTAKKPLSVGLLGNVADVLDELLLRGVKPDLLTDQTSAHDPINGYLPQGWTVEKWDARRVSAPNEVEAAARDSMANHIRAMLTFHALGVPTVDYGNNLRQMALEAGVDNAFDFPGFVPAYIRPLFCRGIGPFRWVALSGDPDDIAKTDAKVKELIPDDAHLHRWLDMAAEKIAFQGLPARICWVGLGDRHRLGLAFNAMVRSGELKAPVVIGRDHLDSGSVASPNRETEAMADGSDAVSDWPLLNALLNTASGATWVSLHHGGGVGMGFSQHAGMVIVCDGSEAADRRLERVLWNDPATGVMRHADAATPSPPTALRKKAWICRAFSAEDSRPQLFRRPRARRTRSACGTRTSPVVGAASAAGDDYRLPAIGRSQLHDGLLAGRCSSGQQCVVIEHRCRTACWVGRCDRLRRAIGVRLDIPLRRRRQRTPAHRLLESILSPVDRQRLFQRVERVTQGGRTRTQPHEVGCEHAFARRGLPRRQVVTQFMQHDRRPVHRGRAGTRIMLRIQQHGASAHLGLGGVRLRPPDESCLEHRRLRHRKERPHLRCQPRNGGVGQFLAQHARLLLETRCNRYQAPGARNEAGKIRAQHRLVVCRLLGNGGVR